MNNYVSNKTQMKNVSVQFLGQAGFIFKSNNISIGVDLYLSHSVERIYGFKRLTPIPISPDKVYCDIIVATHHHEDHLDVDSIESMLKSNSFFVGAYDTKNFIESNKNINKEKCFFLKPGEYFRNNDVVIEAVDCDHGISAPDAIGLIITFSNAKIYLSGDTSLRQDFLKKISRKGPFDIAIFPINGTFGNLNEIEAVTLVEIIKPKIAIPSHFWTFVEQKGDPFGFLNAFKSKKISQTEVIFLALGETILI